MTRPIKTLSVGIPAYNEEANIKALVLALLKQKTKKLKLKEIIIVSDHSSDATETEVRSINSSKIKLIVTGVRYGKYHALNLIFAKANSDVLVTLDADTLVKDKNFLLNISQPLNEDPLVGLVGADTENIKHKTYFEKVVSDSHKIKVIIFRKINHASNIFLCHGRALALSRKYYKKLQLLVNYPTDAQMYLFCLKNNLKFFYEPKAKVLYRSPAVLSDHRKQHERYVNGKASFEGLFAQDFVRAQYHIPFYLVVEFIIRFFFTDPISMFCYLFITIYLAMFKSVNKYQSLWAISNTTKGGIYAHV